MTTQSENGWRLPTLEELEALDPVVLPGFVVQLGALTSAAGARIIHEARRQLRWRTVAWAAEQSGLSQHYFYERAAPDHSDHLLFLKKRGRAVRVDEAGFWRWFKRR